MTKTVSVDEAQDKLPDLLAQALAGNEVIITVHGTPVARLVPVVVHSKKKRVAGLNRGAIRRAKISMNRYQMSFGSARNETFARHSHLHFGGRINQKNC